MFKYPLQIRVTQPCAQITYKPPSHLLLPKKKTMFPHLFRRATSDDTQNTVLDAIFIGKSPDVTCSVHH